MKLITELLDLVQIDEADKKSKVSKKHAAGVYHRDYVKTKHKPYRKYDAAKRRKQQED